MLKQLRLLRDFFLCLLQDACVYSIKKFLSYIFSMLVVYVVIFTNKEYYELLTFVAVLLGLRSYERVKGQSNNGGINNDSANNGVQQPGDKSTL